MIRISWRKKQRIRQERKAVQERKGIPAEAALQQFGKRYSVCFVLNPAYISFPFPYKKGISHTAENALIVTYSFYCLYLYQTANTTNKTCWD